MSDLVPAAEGEATVPKTNRRGLARRAATGLGDGKGGSFLRRRAINVGHLLSGGAVNAGLMLVSMAIAARTLGGNDFGIMVMILTLGRICERLVRFESWQPIVRFAVQPEYANDAEALSRLYLYGLLLDIGGALLAAAITITSGEVLAPLIGLEGHDIYLVAIYSIAVAVNVRGAASAALRLSGKFLTMAYVQVLSGTVRIGLALTCYLLDADLLHVVMVWTFAQALDAIVFFCLGMKTLRNNGIRLSPWMNWRGLPQQFPGFFRFALAGNFSTTLRTLTHEGDTLLVGLLAGNAASGGYHLAKRMGKMLLETGNNIQTVIYPDLARIWSQDGGREFRSLVFYVKMFTGAFVGTCLLTVWLVGKPVIAIVFGSSIPDIYENLLIQLLAVFFMMIAAPLKSALMAMSRPGYILIVVLLTTILFYVVAFYLVPRFGAVGVSFAHLALAALTYLMYQSAYWQFYAWRQSKAGGSDGLRSS